MNGENRVKRQRLPLLRPDGPQTGSGNPKVGSLPVRSRLTGLLSRRNTASHRCVSGTGTGRSPSARSRSGTGAPRFSPPFEKSCKWKNGAARRAAPCHHKRTAMTTYGGITHIRWKGRSALASSQPACASSPVFRCVSYAFFENLSRGEAVQSLFTLASAAKPGQRAKIRRGAS